MNEKANVINLFQVILGFLFLGFCWGFEGETISLAGLLVGAPACVLGIWLLHKLDVALAARHRRPVRRTTRVAARPARYRDAA